MGAATLEYWSMELCLSMMLFVIHLQTLLDKLSVMFPNAVLNAYADDLSMFIESEQQLCAIIPAILCFERTSGTMLNKIKKTRI